MCNWMNRRIAWVYKKKNTAKKIYIYEIPTNLGYKERRQYSENAIAQKCYLDKIY